MKLDISLKSLVGSGLIVWACSANAPKVGHHAAGGSPGNMVAAGGNPAAGGSLGAGGDQLLAAPPTESTSGEPGNGMQMVPDVLADTPAPTLKAGYTTVVATCDIDVDATPTTAVGMKSYYRYAKGSFPGVGVNDLSAVRVLGTFTPEYAAMYPGGTMGYQAFTIPSLIKDGEALVMCGVRYEATPSSSYTYYSKVTFLLPTLSLG